MCHHTVQYLHSSFIFFTTIVQQYLWQVYLSIQHYSSETVITDRLTIELSCFGTYSDFLLTTCIVYSKLKQLVLWVVFLSVDCVVVTAHIHLCTTPNNWCNFHEYMYIQHTICTCTYMIIYTYIVWKRGKAILEMALKAIIIKIIHICIYVN